MVKVCLSATEVIQVFGNKEIELLFGVCRSRVLSTILKLKALDESQLAYLEDKAETMRPVSKDHIVKGDMERVSEIDEIYSTLVGYSTSFLRYLCQSDESVLPMLFDYLIK